MTRIKLIDFYGKTCVPCKQMEPVLDEIKQHFGDDIEVVKICAEENPELTAHYGVMGVPSIFIYVDGDPVYFGKGFQPAGMLIDAITEEL